MMVNELCRKEEAGHWPEEDSGETQARAKRDETGDRPRRQATGRRTKTSK